MAFDEYDKFITDLRTDTRTDAQLKADMTAWQQNMATKMKAHYIAGTSPNIASKKNGYGRFDLQHIAAANAVDGISADESRWISDNTAGPHWLEIHLDQNYAVKKAEITTGNVKRRLHGRMHSPAGRLCLFMFVFIVFKMERIRMIWTLKRLLHRTNRHVITVQIAQRKFPVPRKRVRMRFFLDLIPKRLRPLPRFIEFIYAKKKHESVARFSLL
ncbi:hypothetical protein PAECIP111802_01632 [Paenibacillus allorhizosphaerae]|uniref:Uncharacterized protein n=1 Tax=Paenibacillus allorhizosphaerae TaxID=2849866 RepID=A0ABN7TF27_9BACL|nr:hypothetical protein PAECIP111802_01632 [Paenibacillus allorhizosphaerae]